jgi:hypothetical protein
MLQNRTKANHSLQRTGGQWRFVAQWLGCRSVAALPPLHDVFQGPGGALHYPVPWAEDASISFLETPERVRNILEGLGFSVPDWDDKSQMSREWFVTRIAALDASGPPPLGSHLLMGATSRLKLENNARNLSEQRSVVVQGVLQKA